MRKLDVRRYASFDIPPIEPTAVFAGKRTYIVCIVLILSIVINAITPEGRGGLFCEEVISIY